MYETMSANLESATATEAKQNRDFEDFIAVKETERKEAEALKKQKEGEKAEAELKLADAQQIYDDTLSQKNADIEFFDETKARGMCFLFALSPPSAPLRNCLATVANWDIVPLLHLANLSGRKATCS